MYPVSLKANFIKVLPATILALIFLFPHGIGYRFSIGQVDVPRITLLIVIGCWSVNLLRGGYILKIGALDFGVKLIGLLVMLMLMSGIVSNNIFASTILALQLCALWFVFPLAFNYLSDYKKNIQQLNVPLIFIFTFLFLFSLYEVVFQKYLIPHEYRTSFWGLPEYEWITSRFLYRSGSLLAQGPFMWNHALSGLCAAGSGMAIYAIDKSKNWGLLFLYVFVFLLAFAGVRAGFYAVVISYLLYCAWSKNWTCLLHFVSATILLGLFYKIILGVHAPIFFAGDISNTWFGEAVDANHTRNEFAATASQLRFLPDDLVNYLSQLGTVGVKIMGFLQNLIQIEEWWLLGYGFGSFQRSGVIVSNAVMYDDPGLIQLVFLESGVAAGFMLLLILSRAILLGLKYDNLKYYSVGIFAWVLFALSSWAVWPFLLTMIFVIKIFTCHRCYQNSIAGEHRSPH